MWNATHHKIGKQPYSTPVFQISITILKKYKAIALCEDAYGLCLSNLGYKCKMTFLEINV